MILGLITATPWYLRMVGYKPFRRPENRVRPIALTSSWFVGYFYQAGPPASA